MSKKKRKLDFKKMFLFLFLPLIFIIVLIYLLCTKFSLAKEALGFIDKNISTTNDLPNAEYNISKVDTNSNYSGIGKQKIQDKDGYFSTFTTINENKVYLEYKQNGNSSWSNKPYWENNMETDGCGITAMSIILSGYNKKFTPEDLRKIYYPVLKSDDISFELSNSFDIKNSGFYYDSEHLGNEYIIEHLKTNRPVLVCVWNKPNSNRWTTDSHFIVLLATDGNNMVYVSNPNGLDNTSKSSGWYDINEITQYIAKALFIES